MGKRTIRVPRSKIPAQLGELPGKAVHVVMVDGKTHAGRIQAASLETLVLEDANAAWTSRARHRQRLAMTDIFYIVYDIISPW